MKASLGTQFLEPLFLRTRCSTTSTSTSALFRSLASSVLILSAWTKVGSGTALSFARRRRHLPRPSSRALKKPRGTFENQLRLPSFRGAKFPAESFRAIPKTKRHCCLGIERGIKICAPVHDAVLIESPLDRLKNDVAIMRECMEKASRIAVESEIGQGAQKTSAGNKFQLIEPAGGRFATARWPDGRRGPSHSLAGGFSGSRGAAGCRPEAGNRSGAPSVIVRCIDL